jgi:hypothetical protein
MVTDMVVGWPTFGMAGFVSIFSTIKSGRASWGLGPRDVIVSDATGAGVGVGKVVKTGPWPNARPKKAKKKMMMNRTITKSESTLVFIAVPRLRK